MVVTWYFYYRRNAEIPCQYDLRHATSVWDLLGEPLSERKLLMAYTSVLLQTIIEVEGEGG
jgi:hypothetical protein